MVDDVSYYWWCSGKGHLLQSQVAYCGEHGAESITKCPNRDCQAPLPLDRVDYCESCGQCMPWNQAPTVSRAFIGY
jgi:hypothetical protein